MRKRGFTLMELLVVLGIVLALASVVVPVAVTWSRASHLESAGSQLEATLIMARADAQRHSSPVRVLARMTPSGEVELVSESVSLTDESSVFQDDGAVAPTSASGAPSKDQGESSVDASKVSSVSMLPKGVSVSQSLPSDSPAASGESEASDSSQRSERREGDWMLLAVFLPDGEVVRPGPRYLVDGQGKAAQVCVESWSGRVSVKQLGRGPAGRAASFGPEPAKVVGAPEEAR